MSGLDGKAPHPRCPSETQEVSKCVFQSHRELELEKTEGKREKTNLLLTASDQKGLAPLLLTLSGCKGFWEM